MTARKIILWVVLLIIATNLALVGVVLMGTMASIPAAPSLPSPNGRDDFVKAGTLLTTTADSYRELNPAQLRGVIVSNAPSVSLVRLGMTKECLVPLEELRWKREAHLAQLNAFKLLALAFSAEATMAELQKRPNDAADTLLDVIRFSHDFSRGGAYIDAGMEWQCENFAMTQLAKLTPALDAHGCAFVARGLAEVDAKSQSLEELKNQELIYNGRLTFHQSASHLVHYKRMRIYNEKVAKQFDVQTRQRRQAIVNFAARAYELEKGKKPASSADLVPAYLKAVPTDPVTGAKLEYAP